MMMKVSMPVEASSKALRDGSLTKTVMGFVEQMKPEAAYFFSEGGKRTGLFFFDLKDPSSIPLVVEPFFMNLSAAVELTPAMNLEDMKAGVEKALKKT
jgi:hypothetical protein